MEENGQCFTLVEAITHLLTKGYDPDFKPLGGKASGLPKAHSLNYSPDDFFIDEIFRCEDGEGEEKEITYVFAVSSRRYGLKGIVTNILKEEDSENLGLLRKIRMAFSGFREYFSKN